MTEDRASSIRFALIIFALIIALPWAFVYAQRARPSGNSRLIENGPEVIFASNSETKTVCFGDDSLDTAKQVGDTATVAPKDCLPLSDLRTLVAGRGAPGASMVAYTQAQQTADAFRTAYAKAENDLGDCQAALAPWTKIGGAIAAGTSMVVDLPTLKAKIEAANPGKTIGQDWKIVDKAVK